MGGRERDHLVVDQVHGPGGGDDLDIAQGGRPTLARDDPDGAVGHDPLAQRPDPGQLVRRICHQHDDVRVRPWLAVADVVRSLAESGPELDIVDPDDRHAGAGPDPELVDEGGPVHALHRAMVPRMSAHDEPLVVFGPHSLEHDFGPHHPLTPRRFGPGIDLLEALGARPGLAPQPASDEELLAVHEPGYLATVRRFSADPRRAPAMGIGPGDVPPFAGMHEAAAAVAGGTLRALEAILRGDVAHAFHPGGGLHHAMAGRAAGFCIYNDVALAIALARRVGLRVMYIDLDVHHGDGVEAIHRDDPDVLTVSIHETGRTLFPGTGAATDVGGGPAVGTVVNLPVEPMAGDEAWLAAIKVALPALAEAFRPDLVVSQHGSDAHAWDPLAHLGVTTTAMSEAARLVDTIAHDHADGRWLSTGGGGYEVYRVVPRAWALVWLAAAHREVPVEIPAGWRERWTAEAARYDAGPLPERLLDEPNVALTRGPGREAAAHQAEAMTALVVDRALHALSRRR